MRYTSLNVLLFLASATESAHLAPRAAPICSTLQSCYARFTEATAASAYCTNFLVAPTKSVTTIQTLSASTKVITKIVTLKGTTTVPQTVTINGAASYVTSYQSCTTATGLPANSQSVASVGNFKKRQASASAPAPSAPGCLQYMVATPLASTSAACKCIAAASTPITSITKTVTPKVATYTWTGTVSLTSTIRPVTTITVGPVYTVVMDPLPCSLTTATSSASTPSSTSATSVPSVVPALCNNQGQQFSILEYIYQYGGSDFNNFQSFWQTMQTTFPDLQGISSTVGGFDAIPDSSNMATVYNTTSFYGEWFALQQEGYMYASQTGTYNFSFPIGANDFLGVWLGPNAASGSTIGNTIINSNGYNFQPFSFQYVMTAGTYYPMKILFANSYGAGGYDLTIYNPDGSILTQNGDQGNPSFVQYSCDGTTAPPFPVWA